MEATAPTTGTADMEDGKVVIIMEAIRTGRATAAATAAPGTDRLFDSSDPSFDLPVRFGAALLNG